MRPIHIARLDKPRPVVVLTRELIRPRLTNVTVAPITSTIRGLSTEVLVGPQQRPRPPQRDQLRQHPDHPESSSSAA